MTVTVVQVIVKTVIVTMARILLLVLLVAVASEAAHKHHPKFPKSNEEPEVPLLRKGDYILQSIFLWTLNIFYLYFEYFYIYVPNN